MPQKKSRKTRFIENYGVRNPTAVISDREVLSAGVICYWHALFFRCGYDSSKLTLNLGETYVF